MNKTLFFMPVLSVLLIGQGAYAADQTDGLSSSMAVAKVICEKHFVADDVNYKPGVDVDGNPVAPADISAPPIDVPEYMEVPLSIDLAQVIKIPMADTIEMKPVLGNLKLYKDGHVEYNGQDISDKVATFCGVDTRSNPDPQPVAAPRVIEDQKPVAGSVSASSTVEPPKPKAAFGIPRSTVNMNHTSQ
ncbi:MAG: hypothetical protein AUJ12_05555 [Alphaproteobacteria bacterium CG1_02_46_17]|nr:MAG: hypothetical protein AUJ12_05555 [Alphaproteobacteria bacterium CG1_02_46_17]